MMQKETFKQAKKILKKIAVSQTYIQCDIAQKAKGELLCYQVCRREKAGKNLKAEMKVIKTFGQDVFHQLETLEWLDAVPLRDMKGDCAEAARYYQVSPIGKSALRRSLSGGGDFLAQHQTLRSENRTVEGQKCTVTYVDKDSPLSWLARRKDRQGQPMISAEALQAGLRLERDFYFAGMEANVTANWSAAGGSGGKSRKHGAKGGAQTADHIMDAQDRMRKVTAFLGSEMSAVLLDVCCFHQGLEQLEKARYWPKRSGKVVLQLGLHRLAEYYGLLVPETRQTHYRALSSWGAEDYRPKI